MQSSTCPMSRNAACSTTTERGPRGNKGPMMAQGLQARDLKRSAKLFMDETGAPVFDPGHGRTRTGWLWALARDDRRLGRTRNPSVADGIRVPDQPD